MKGLLVVLALLLAGIAGLGFYRGWFRVSTGNADHKSNVTFTVDQDKIRQDGQTVQGSTPRPEIRPKGKEPAGDRTDKANERGHQP